MPTIFILANVRVILLKSKISAIFQTPHIESSSLQTPEILTSSNTRFYNKMGHFPPRFPYFRLFKIVDS